jgi:hypothetical protein
LVTNIGWAECGDLILEIIEPSRFSSQLPHFVRLVNCLIDCYCYQGAKEVADKIYSVFSSSTQDAGKLPHNYIQTYLEMVIHLEDNPSTAGAQCVTSIQTFLTSLTEEQLGKLIVNFKWENLLDTARFEVNIFLSICQKFLSRATLFKIPKRKLIFDLLNSFIQLKDDAFIQIMVANFCSALLVVSESAWDHNFKFSLLMQIVQSSENILAQLPKVLKELLLGSAIKVVKNWIKKTSLYLSSLDIVKRDENEFGIEITNCINLFIVLVKLRLIKLRLKIRSYQNM